MYLAMYNEEELSRMKLLLWLGCFNIFQRPLSSSIFPFSSVTNILREKENNEVN